VALVISCPIRAWENENLHGSPWKCVAITRPQDYEPSKRRTWHLLYVENLKIPDSIMVSKNTISGARTHLRWRRTLVAT